MKNPILRLLVLLLFMSCSATQAVTESNPPKAIKSNFLLGKEKKEGFFNFYWDKKTGKVHLEVDKLDYEFLYVNSLPAGVGSNDIGLDRGQLGDNRVVKFVRSGPRLLLIQPNYSFRAESENEAERKSVEEAFAQSVLWGFPIESEKNGTFTINVTPFMMRDAHGVVSALVDSKQGLYKLDKTRSVVHESMTRNFPKNTELEALLTFVGKPKGAYVRDVVPSPEAITVRQRHSFIELPDDNYKPRTLDPRCGFFGIDYKDYATEIDEPMVKRFINRHRLEKKNPIATISEPVEPIIYYVDRGAPEPILSALLDGARWWNQAFEEAGYKNAFQVEVLPEGVDPMDIRYNVIQWVHRSTRGWSYGGSVSDPRTGEIMKGHVSLGSLRVRQDFLIAQGLLSPYETGKPVSDEMKQMALARLRQLSAHEVGHTLGITHNFAASTNGRASVMDYPHPYIALKEDGRLDFSKAYDDKIGEWDKRAILYGYQDFPKGTDEPAALKSIIKETHEMNLRFISDRDARPVGGAHPYAHLWDNGEDAVDELNRLLKVRQVAMARFGENTIPMETPMASLEEVLAPLYLSHRYQVEAVAKMIGGVEYQYTLRGDGHETVKVLDANQQKKALTALLKTLDPKTLMLSEKLLKQLPPKPFGYSRGRESFKSKTGLTFDPIAVAESAAQHTLSMLLNPQRATRLVQHHALDNSMPSLTAVIDELLATTWQIKHGEDYQGAIGRMVDHLVLKHLMRLSANEKAASQVRAIALLKINNLAADLESRSAANESQKAHHQFALSQIAHFNLHPKEMLQSESLKMPDGSPIGSDYRCEH